MTPFEVDIIAYKHYRDNLMKIVATFDDPKDYATAIALARELVTVDDKLKILEQCRKDTMGG